MLGAGRGHFTLGANSFSTDPDKQYYSLNYKLRFFLLYVVYFKPPYNYPLQL